MAKRLLVSLLVCFIIISGCVNPKTKFDQRIWAASDKCDVGNPRYLMVEDLQNNYFKVGTEKADVIKLLGVGNEINNSIIYIVGDDGIADCLILEIAFDKNNKLKTSRVVQG